MSRLLWERTAVVGLAMAAGTLFTFRWELDSGGTVESARTVALTTMVLFQAFHLGNVRSETVSALRISPFSNRFLLLAASVALLIHAAALYLPVTQYLLRVEPLDIGTWLLCLAVASSVLVAGELHKLIHRHRARWRAG